MATEINQFNKVEVNGIKIVNDYNDYRLNIQDNPGIFDRYLLNDYTVIKTGTNKNTGKGTIEVKFSEIDIYYKIPFGSYQLYTGPSFVSLGTFERGKGIILTYKKKDSKEYNIELKCINDTNKYSISVNNNSTSIITNTDYVEDKPKPGSGSGNGGNNGGGGNSGGGNSGTTPSVPTMEFPTELNYKLTVYPTVTNLKTNNNGEQSIVGVVQGFYNNQLVLQKNVTNTMSVKNSTGDLAIFKSYSNGLLKYDKGITTSNNIDIKDLYLLRFDNISISGMPSIIYSDQLTASNTVTISGNVYLYKRISSTQMVQSSDWTKVIIHIGSNSVQKLIAFSSGLTSVSFSTTVEIMDIVDDAVYHNYMHAQTTINNTTYSKYYKLIDENKIFLPIYYGVLSKTIVRMPPDTKDDILAEQELNDPVLWQNKKYITCSGDYVNFNMRIHKESINNFFIYISTEADNIIHGLEIFDSSNTLICSGEYETSTNSNLLLHKDVYYVYSEYSGLYPISFEGDVFYLHNVEDGYSENCSVSISMYAPSEISNSNNNLSSYPELVATGGNGTSIPAGTHTFTLTFAVNINGNEYTADSVFNITTSNTNINKLINLSFTRPTSALPSTGSLPKFMAFELQNGTNITNQFIVGKDLDLSNAIITTQAMTADGYKKISYSNQTLFDLPLQVLCFYVWADATQYEIYEYFMIPGNGEYSLTVSESSKDFTYSSGSFSFDITSNTFWVISVSNDFITVNKTMGTNNDTINVTITENTSTSARSGSIVVKAKMTNLQRNITITQAKKPSSSGGSGSGSGSGSWGTYSPSNTNITLLPFGLETKTLTVHLNESYSNIYAVRWTTNQGSTIQYITDYSLGTESVTIKAIRPPGGRAIATIVDKNDPDNSEKYLKQIQFSVDSPGYAFYFDNQSRYPGYRAALDPKPTNNKYSMVVGETKTLKVYLDPDIADKVIVLWRESSSNTAARYVSNNSPTTTMQIIAEDEGTSSFTLIIRDADYPNDETGANDLKNYSFTVKSIIVVNPEISINWIKIDNTSIPVDGMKRVYLHPTMAHTVEVEITTNIYANAHLDVNANGVKNIYINPGTSTVTWNIPVITWTSNGRITGYISVLDDNTVITQTDNFTWLPTNWDTVTDGVNYPVNVQLKTQLGENTNYPGDEFSFDLTIISKIDFNISSTDSWISFSPSSGGAGLYGLRMYVDQNTTGTSRTGHIVLTSTDPYCPGTRTLTFTQTGTLKVGVDSVWAYFEPFKPVGTNPTVDIYVSDQNKTYLIEKYGGESYAILGTFSNGDTFKGNKTNLNVSIGESCWVAIRDNSDNKLLTWISAAKKIDTTNYQNNLIVL